MIRRRVMALGLATVVVTLVSGCGLVPAAAPPMTVTASPTEAAATGGGVAATSKPTPEPGFSDLERAALRVRNIGCDNVGRGSGLAIGDHEFITNRHVVGGADALEVSTYDGRDIRVTAVGVTVVADLAVVHTADPLPATVRLAASNPEVGTGVTAVGYPLGGELTTSHGKVLGYARDPVGWSSLPMLLNDAHIEHGSSGSPLVNDAGEVVGVVYAGTGPGRYYAVPVEILNTMLATAGVSPGTGNCDGVPSGSGPQEASCSASVNAGPKTSCAFALKVKAAWLAAGQTTGNVEAFSPVTRRTYTMYCEAGSPTVCRGGTDAVVYIFR